MSMSQTPASQTPKRPETKQQITVLGPGSYQRQTATKGKSESKVFGNTGHEVQWSGLLLNKIP
jgi:hypothetical protein